MWSGYLSSALCRRRLGFCADKMVAAGSWLGEVPCSFPVPAKKNPCSNQPGICCNTLELLRELTSTSAESIKKCKHSLLSSLFSARLCTF